MSKASLQPVDTGLVTVDALPLLDELALRQQFVGTRTETNFGMTGRALELSQQQRAVLVSCCCGGATSAGSRTRQQRASTLLKTFGARTRQQRGRRQLKIQQPVGSAVPVPKTSHCLHWNRTGGLVFVSVRHLNSLPGNSGVSGQAACLVARGVSVKLPACHVRPSLQPHSH